MTPTSGATRDRLLRVRERIESACVRAGRAAESVTLIGVTKTHPAAAVREAWDAGLRDFGENRAQEGCAKVHELAADNIRPTWNFIGHLQTNKVREVVAAFDVIHSVDSERLLAAIEQEVTRQSREPIDVFVEVNVAGEASKDGVAPAEAVRLVERARRSNGVRLRGLMTVAPLAAEPELVRPAFRHLRELAHSMELGELSMGMTGDFEVAIEEGATHIRVGRALFGERSE